MSCGVFSAICILLSILIDSDFYAIINGKSYYILGQYCFNLFSFSINQHILSKNMLTNVHFGVLWCIGYFGESCGNKTDRRVPTNPLKFFPRITVYYRTVVTMYMCRP